MVVAYAEEALAASAAPESLARFDGMRRLRNRSEYGGIERVSTPPAAGMHPA